MGITCRIKGDEEVVVVVWIAIPMADIGLSGEISHNLLDVRILGYFSPPGITGLLIDTNEVS